MQPPRRMWSSHTSEDACARQQACHGDPRSHLLPGSWTEDEVVTVLEIFPILINRLASSPGCCIEHSTFLDDDIVVIPPTHDAAILTQVWCAIPIGDSHDVATNDRLNVVSNLLTSTGTTNLRCGLRLPGVTQVRTASIVYEHWRATCEYIVRVNIGDGEIIGASVLAV